MNGKAKLGGASERVSGAAAGGMRCCGLQRQHKEGHTFSGGGRATLT